MLAGLHNDVESLSVNQLKLQNFKAIHISQEGGDKKWRAGGVYSYVKSLSEMQAHQKIKK